MGIHRTCATPFSRFVVALGVGATLGVPLYEIDRPAAPQVVTPTQVESAVSQSRRSAAAAVMNRSSRSYQRVDAARSLPKRNDILRILSPVGGSLIDKHEPTVELREIRFSWTERTDATGYLVTLVDTTTGAFLKRSENVLLSTAFTLSDVGFRYGHAYRCTVVALLGNTTMTDTVTFKIRVLPN